MKSNLAAIFCLLGQLATSGAVRTACPLLGPGYPSPADISGSSSLGASAWANLTAMLDSYVSGAGNVGGINFGNQTFSLGVFSIHDTEAHTKLQYHHIPTSSGNSTKCSSSYGTAGVSQADGDSIYRIGSISKVMTVYLTLVQIGDGYWDEPVTKYVPELAAALNASMTQGFDPITDVRWDQVTLGTLAGQMSGIARDTSNAFEELALILEAKKTDPSTVGLPTLNTTELPICATGPKSTSCDRKDYFTELLQRAPIYAPWATSPIYSDAAYEILGFALEGITGISFDSMFADVFNNRLGMTNTFAHPPLDRLNDSVIPFGQTSGLSSSLFEVDLGNETAPAGMYSTLNDLNKLGAAILNSTLLCPDVTRRWLKPITHSSSLTQSAGRPWEILRFTQQASGGRINDLYTKEGNLGSYSAYLILSPDHDAGLNVLTAGKDVVNFVNLIADIWSETVLVAWEAQAKEEAAKKLAGTYTLMPDNSNNNSNNDTNTNTTSQPSSITLAVPSGNDGAGLQITNWTSQGVDFFIPVESFLQSDDIRLYPVSLVSSGDTNEIAKVAFRAVYGSDAPPSPARGFFSDELSCGSWHNVDDKLYGKQALDSFIMELDPSGDAVAMEVPALRVRLLKTA